MTKQTTTVDVSSFTTDAKFRSWGLAMSTAMQATPLVKTSDTGQINWVTVTKPVATSTKAGYEIYRFSDSLQATKPVYIRVDYGSSATASGNQPNTWVHVGTGTDGAGTITGANTGSVQGYTSAATPAHTSLPGYFTHTSNGYAFMAFGMGLTAAGAVSNAGFWAVARTVHPTTGVATGDGVVLINFRNSSGSGSAAQYGINFNTSTSFTSSAVPHTSLLNLSASIATGTLIPLGKLYIPIGDLFPTSAALSYWGPDIVTASTFSASPFGTSHTYLAWGATQGGSFSAAAANVGANASPAAIWED